MTELISTISNLSIVQLLVVGFVVIILQKSGIDVIGFIQSLLRKNGKNGNGNGTKEKLGEIDEHLELLTSNHITHVQKGIDKLIEMQEKENVTLALMAQSLEDIKDNLK